MKMTTAKTIHFLLRIDRKNQIILPEFISAEFDSGKLNFVEIMFRKFKNFIMTEEKLSLL